MRVRPPLLKHSTSPASTHFIVTASHFVSSLHARKHVRQKLKLWSFFLGEAGFIRYSYTTDIYFGEGTPRHYSWLCSAVMTTVFTMSSTVQPRERSFTGLARPCMIGPTAMVFEACWTAL